MRPCLPSGKKVSQKSPRRTTLSACSILSSRARRALYFSWTSPIIKVFILILSHIQQLFCVLHHPSSLQPLTHQNHLCLYLLIQTVNYHSYHKESRQQMVYQDKVL